MLVAVVKGQRVEAAKKLERGQEFRCPGCQAGVILKAGNIKIAHFAHQPGAGCSYAVGETVAHMTAKKWFCEAARARGLKAELEFPIGDQRADVAIWAPDGTLFVIEIQHSNLEVDELKRRIVGYRRKGIPHLWVPTIGVKYRDDVIARHIERYSIRQFERYLNVIYKIGMWFYVEDENFLVFGEFDTHEIYKDGGEFYDSYSYSSKRWKELRIREVRTFDDIGFKLGDYGHGVELLPDGDDNFLSDLATAYLAEQERLDELRIAAELAKKIRDQEDAERRAKEAEDRRRYLERLEEREKLDKERQRKEWKEWEERAEAARKRVEEKERLKRDAIEAERKRLTGPNPERKGLDHYVDGRHPHYCADCGAWANWGYPSGEIANSTWWFCFEHKPA